MIVGVVGVGKARGVTTVATGLATALGETFGNSVIVEADPSGGDLAAWRGLSLDDGGVLRFASEVGSSRDFDGEGELADRVESSVVRVGSGPGCAVMALGVGGSALSGQVEAMWEGRSELLEWPGVVVVDLGRWGSRLCSDMWSSMSMGVVVAAGDVAGLRRARLGVDVAPMLNAFPTVRIVNGSAWDLDEINRSSGIDFDMALSWEVRTAERIRLGDWKAARRRHLGRQFLDMARAMVEARA